MPAGLSDWTSARFLGVSPIFWVGVGLTVVLIVAFGSPRRAPVPVVGANPVASRVVGLRVTLNQILAYVVAAILYAIAGIPLAAFLATPGSTSARRTSSARSRRS